MIKTIKNFRHSGDMGDIIYSLPVLKLNYGGIFLIDQNLSESQKRIKNLLKPGLDIFFDWGENGGMKDYKFNFLKPLLEKQKYILKIKSYQKDHIDIDLDNFRLEKGDNCIYHKYIKIFDLPQNIFDDPWLKVDKKEIAQTVVSRTTRYNNDFFPWEKILEKNKDIIFLGLEQEYKKFVDQFGYIPKYEVKDAWDLACVINGAKLFVGNQSLAYSIAEGLKKNTIQETCTRLPDCIFPRPNAIYFINNKFVKIDYYVTQYS